MSIGYAEFIENKSQIGGMSGFEPTFMLKPIYVWGVTCNGTYLDSVSPELWIAEFRLKAEIPPSIRSKYAVQRYRLVKATERKAKRKVVK